ncbi:Indoleamine 2,3-dioxygenase [Lentinula edodes]|nr:Indoleamine 2,3-dioxygenase [Lentinula edodes]
MPRHHRNFLSHLREQSRRRSLRAWVLESATLQLLNTYNPTVTVLKKFRDAHIVLMARYIIGPAAWDKLRGDSQSLSEGKEVLKGTGGTHLTRFLKSVRDNTWDTVIQ